MLAVAPPIRAAEDPQLTRLLAGVGKDAGRFWSNAPGFIGHETWTEYSVATPAGPTKRRLHFSISRPKTAAETTVTRQIVSLYALAPFRKHAESLFEFRQVLSIDGKPAGDAAELLRQFKEELASGDEKRLRKIRQNFERQAMSGVMIDFGQLILLFTRPRQKQYSYTLKPAERIGAETAVRIEFTQQSGDQGLHIDEPGKQEENAPLHGQIMVRPEDGAVLQIRLTSDRKQDGAEIHDEAQVDYAHRSGGMVLPVSVVHRRTQDKKALYQDTFTYADWEAIGPPARH